MHIYPASIQDALQIASLYSYYVRNTAITFACEEPTPEHYAQQIEEGRYPFLVARDEHGLAGFAYAASFRQKEAFRWDVELTIYLRPGLEGKGRGTRLMQALLNCLRRQGYLLAYSCITLPNPGSIALHKHFGFDELGVFPRTGYKLGIWHDVIWLQKALDEPMSEPREPIPFSALDAEEVDALLANP